MSEAGVIILQVLFAAIAFAIYRNKKSGFSLLILSYFALWPIIGATAYYASSDEIPIIFTGLVFALCYLGIICENYQEYRFSIIALLSHVVFSVLYLSSYTTIASPYVGQSSFYDMMCTPITMIIELVLLIEAHNGAVRAYSNNTLAGSTIKSDTYGHRRVK